MSNALARRHHRDEQRAPRTATLRRITRVAGRGGLSIARVRRRRSGDLAAGKRGSQMFHRCSKRARGRRVPDAVDAQVRTTTGGGLQHANRCESATSPREATRMKKPGTANFVDSGHIGADHRNSNRRPSPWQGADEDVQGDATRVNPAESLALPLSAGEAVLSADATRINGATDAVCSRI